MDDPCRNCDILEKRNVFFHDHHHQLLNILKGAIVNSPFEQTDYFNAGQEQFKAILESSFDCIVVLDKDCNCLYANQAAIGHANTTRDKIIGKNIRDGLGHIPDFMRLWLSRIEEVFKTGKPMRVTDTAPVGDKVVYSESVLSPIRYPNGQLFAVGVVYRDITEQKKMEQELAESERKYRELYDQAQIPLYRTRVSDGKMLECNQAMATLFGYDSKEECLADCFSVSHYVDPSRRTELLKRLKEEGSVRGSEIEFTRRDGTHAWVEIAAKLYPEEGYIEGTLIDVTTSKVLSKAEKKILDLIMQGKCNKEIARILGRSVRTIEDHRAHIMQKLNASNLVELVQKTQSFKAEPKK